MTRGDRLLLAAAMLALMAGLAGPVLAAEPTLRAGTADAHFAPPGGPFVLTRELRKGFGGGHEFVSRRRYRIHFVREATGWRVDGALVASEVEAPPGMPPQMAELERSRSDDRLFPMHLDASGAILVQRGAADPAGDARTLAAARAALAGSALGPAERMAALDLAAQLQAQARAAGGNWPEDLFRPARGQRRESRAIPMGGGAEGTVTVTIEADGDRHGLLTRLQRQITTQAGGTSRLSTETWTLSPGA